MAKIKKRFSFADNYRKSWEYIKESKRFIFAIIGIFSFFTLIGLFIPVPESVYNLIMDYIREILGMTEGLSAGGLISFIFFNNVQSSFFGLAFGIILGIFPIFASFFNGYLLGFVLNASISAEGVFVIWKLVPHGIFELPAVFISLGMGLRLGTEFLFKRKKNLFRNNLMNSLRVFLLIIVPLLLVAAVIEGLLIFFAN